MSTDDKEAALRALEGDDDDAVVLTEALEHEEHPILTREELAEIRAEAIAKVEKERRSAARKEVLEREIESARREAGLATGGPNDEMVNLTLDLAEHSEDIRLNGVSYRHGGTYRVPRHVADTLREISFRGWKHQNEIDGKSLTHFYQTKRNTVLSMVSGAVRNAPLAS